MAHSRHYRYSLTTDNIAWLEEHTFADVAKLVKFFSIDHRSNERIDHTESDMF